MKNLMFLGVLLLLILPGCSRKKLVISAANGGNLASVSKDNTWINEDDTKENVDISDINNASTVTPVQDNTSTKMERITFPVSEYNSLARRGKGTIRGIIYLKDAYGKAILGKSTRLYLNPITSYSKQWYNESYLGGYKMQKADSRLFNYLRFTASDDEGKFAFYGVPSGRYYLIGTVKCGSECGYSVTKNVRIASEVRISGNQIVEKRLTRLLD